MTAPEFDPVQVRRGMCWREWPGVPLAPGSQDRDLAKLEATGKRIGEVAAAWRAMLAAGSEQL